MTANSTFISHQFYFLLAALIGNFNYKLVPLKSDVSIFPLDCFKNHTVFFPLIGPLQNISRRFNKRNDFWDKWPPTSLTLTFAQSTVDLKKSSNHSFLTTLPVIIQKSGQIIPHAVTGITAAMFFYFLLRKSLWTVCPHCLIKHRVQL